MALRGKKNSDRCQGSIWGHKAFHLAQWLKHLLSTGIQYGHQFTSQLLHFQLNTLLDTAAEDGHGALSPTREAWNNLAPEVSLSQRWPMWPFKENQGMKAPPPNFLQINTSFLKGKLLDVRMDYWLLWAGEGDGEGVEWAWVMPGSRVLGCRSCSEIMVMAAQLWKFPKCHWIVHFRWMVWRHEIIPQ